MDDMKRWLGVLLVALGAFAQEEAREVRVDLQAGVPTEEVHLGYGGARPLLVESTAPRFLMKVPEFRAEDPLFFRVSLGETKGSPFYAALDRSPEGSFHDLLHLDRNRDLDLTNDGEPVRGRTRTLWSSGEKLVEFTGVTLDVPYTVDGQEAREPYACLFYYVAREEQRPKTVQVERDGWRQGLLTLGEAGFVIALVDDDSDGQFTNSDSWALRPVEENRSLLLVADATRSMLFPSWSADQKWTVDVKSVDPAGRSLVAEVRPAKESEREYFTRIATARQSPEERRLKIDPLRPKAKDGDAIDWITGKDVEYALGIAGRANVQKPVLLEFTAQDCEWCARLEQFTYRDREVVQLADRFVCAKIAFAKGTADAMKYSVSGTPTLVVLGLDGTEIARHNGFARPTELAAWLKSALR